MAYTSVKISASSSDYQSQMKSAAEQMKTLSSEYSLAATKAKLFGSAADTLKAKAESLTSKIAVQKNIVKMNSEQQEKLTKNLSDQKAKQEELKTKIEAAKEAYAKATEETEKNSEQSKTLKEELEKLEQEFKANETAIGKTETALSNQTVKTNKAETALMEMEEELKKVNTELKNHKFNVFADGCDKAGKKMEQFGKRMMVVTTGIAGLATASIKAASDFDSSMSNVQAISGATAEDMEILRNKAREMGEKTKFSAMEAGDAMSYMAMAGWKTEDMLNSIEGIMTLAAASGEDLALTSDIVTDAMTAFGLSADGTTKIIKDGYVKEVSNATHFADVLAAASSNANTNVSLLGESFKYVAPVAGALGYSAEDTAIALGLMANAGIKASNSGTALRSMLTNLSKPSDEVENAMNYLGISLQNNDDSMKTLMEVMQELRASFGKCKMPIEEFQNQLAELETQYEAGELTEKKYNAAVEDLTEKAYGAEGALKAKYAATLAGKTGMSGLLAIVGSSDKDFDKLTNAIYESDGAAQEMADIMQDNLAGQVTILKSQLQELGISIGEQLIPFIRDGVSAIQNIVNEFNSMSDSQKQTIIKVGLFTAAVGPAVIGIGKFAQGISTTVKTGQKLVSGISSIVAKITAKTAATAAGTAADTAATAATTAHTTATAAGAAATGGMTAAQRALNLVMSMNPIMKVVTVVSLLVAGFVALYNNSETFRNAVNKLWETIKAVFGKIKETIGNVLGESKNVVIESLANMKTAYEENGGGIKGIVAAGWEGIKGYYSSGLTFIDNLTGGKLTEIKSKFLNSEIGQSASKMFGTVKETAQKVMSATVETTKQNLLNMKTAYEENGGGIKGIVAAGLEGIKGYYSSGLTFINTLTGGKLTEIKNKFSTNLNNAFSTVSSIMEKICAKFNEKMEAAKSIVSGAIEKIKSFFSFKWQLPELELPHFSIEGKFSLSPPSVPKLSVEWYRTGGIMTNPTVFGVNGTRLMVGGEAGAEAILPLGEFYTRLASMLDSRMMAMEAVGGTLNMMVDQEKVIERLESIEKRIEKLKITEIIKLVPDNRRIFKIVRAEAAKEQEATGKKQFEKEK